jgi:hypothetical protein
MNYLGLAEVFLDVMFAYLRSTADHLFSVVCIKQVLEG